MQLAQRLGVDVRFFDIIYKLLEDLEEIGQKGRPIKMRRKKIGDATISLKFLILKNWVLLQARRSMMAFFLVREMLLFTVVSKKIGAGKITSLQRDKNPAKEVRKGFECAFMVEKFTEWQVGDHVECFIDVPEAAE